MMNICIGAINAIPTEYYEAADVDGASKLVQFFKITLPSIAQTAWPLIISSFAFLEKTSEKLSNNENWLIKGWRAV